MPQVIKSDDIGREDKWSGKLSVDDIRRKLMEQKKKKK